MNSDKLSNKDQLAADALALGLSCSKVERDGWESCWVRNDGLHIWLTPKYFRSAWLEPSKIGNYKVYARHQTHGTIEQAYERNDDFDVQCNNCGWKGYEEWLLLVRDGKDGAKACPKCDKGDACLADIEKVE